MVSYGYQPCLWLLPYRELTVTYGPAVEVSKGGQRARVRARGRVSYARYLSPALPYKNLEL